MNEKSYLTLKEAAQKTGYTPEYIGQLIRNGKLPGKRIYSGVSWVTTEKALEEFLCESGRKKKSRFTSLKRLSNRANSETGLEWVLRITLYAAIFLGAVIVLGLFSIFSLNIDRKLESNTIQHIEPVLP